MLPRNVLIGQIKTLNFKTRLRAKPFYKWVLFAWEGKKSISYQGLRPQGLFAWSGGPRSSGVSFFCFHPLGDTKQKKLTPLDRGPPLHVNRVLVLLWNRLLEATWKWPIIILLWVNVFKQRCLLFYPFAGIQCQGEVRTKIQNKRTELVKKATSSKERPSRRNETGKQMSSNDS